MPTLLITPHHEQRPPMHIVVHHRVPWFMCLCAIPLVVAVSPIVMIIAGLMWWLEPKRWGKR